MGHSLPRSHRSHAEVAAWGRGWLGGSEPGRWKALGGVARTDVDDRLQRACAPARAGSGSCGLNSDALAAASRRFLRSPPVCQWREPARVDRGMGSAALAWQQAHHASEFAALCSARAVRALRPSASLIAFAPGALKEVSRAVLAAVLPPGHVARTKLGKAYSLLGRRKLAKVL